MDETRLTPQLGRLIDAAKAASREATHTARVEGIALLTSDGTVLTGCTGSAEIVAAAVAEPDDPAETVPPTRESYRLLADIDPDLPLVFKQRGRWVLLPLSRVEPRG